jgi:hypothetical protein
MHARKRDWELRSKRESLNDSRWCFQRDLPSYTPYPRHRDTGRAYGGEGKLGTHPVPPKAAFTIVTVVEIRESFGVEFSVDDLCWRAQLRFNPPPASDGSESPYFYVGNRTV